MKKLAGISASRSHRFMANRRGNSGSSDRFFSWAPKSLKDDAVKVLHSICQQIWKTRQCPQDRKRPVFITIPKAIPKKAQNTAQLHSSHTLVK